VSGLASKPVMMVCEWFGLKTTWTVSSGLASKPAVTVFVGLASKPVATVFSSLASKLVAMVSPGLASKPAISFLVESQNQGGGGFSNLCLKTGSSGLVIYASKSPRRFLGLGLKTNQASICQLRHRWREVDTGYASRSSGLFDVEASLARVFQSGLKTGRDAMTGGAHGCVGSYYPTFAVFNVLDPMSIVVI
jgi:hypothetical protein